MILKMAKILVFSLMLSSLSQKANAQATTGSLDQNADQSQGQYMPMNMGYAGFNSLGMVQSAWLDPLQNLGEGQSKPAYSRYYWSPDLVLPIRLREGMMTLLNFPEWEMVEDMYIGDNATFDGQISGPNTILLYPRKGANVGVDTNIIIFGRSGNRYVFYVKSEGVNTERLTNSIIDIDVVGGGSGSNGSTGSGGGTSSSFGGRSGGGVNSGSNLSADSTFTKRFRRNSWIKEIPLDPSKLRFDIEVYVPNPDDVVISPERVWRDDIFTYIDLGEKALNMTQRPIVTLIVERIEVPVGFRTKGPNNRLIIVEGIGDMVMRNGKRIVCLKMRRSDGYGQDMATYATDFEDASWDVGPTIPNSEFDSNRGNSGMPGQYDIQVGNSEIVARGNGNTANIDVNYTAGQDFDYSKMQRIQNTQNYSSIPQGFGYGSGFSNNSGGGSNLSVELGTDADVNNLEKLWDSLSTKYSGVLNGREPFFSVDTPADGKGRELFHLRVGPVNSLEDGDYICGELGRKGVFCSVVRTQ